MEEADKADQIGFMRSGRILVEGSPAKIKSRFGRPSLDDVFFTICTEDEGERGKAGDTTDATSRRFLNSTNGHPVPQELQG